MQGPVEGETYDVFISHRGPDTKYIFVNLLAARLENHGITVFYDKKDLHPTAEDPAWEIMEASLLAAKIQVFVGRLNDASDKSVQFFLSKVASSYHRVCLQIGVCSPNYTKSKWCREELKIMNITPERILPVFYNVEPESFENAPAKTGFVYKSVSE